jgi:hypothetical protein
MNNDLQDLLREAGRATPRNAPEEVEAALRAEFRAHRQRGRRRQISFALIAASILLLMTAALLRVAPKPAPAAARTPGLERTTPFLPMAGRELLAPMEYGHVIRVRLPRSTMASFGLPVNEARAGEMVSADVLLGEDGLARAVRFIQMESSIR